MWGDKTSESSTNDIYNSSSWKTGITYGGIDDIRMNRVQETTNEKQGGGSGLIWSLFEGDPALVSAVIIGIIGLYAWLSH